MTRRVLRYAIEVADETEVRFPHRNVQFIHVAPSRVDPEGLIDVWFEAPDTPGQWVDVRFHVEGTGHPIMHDGRHIGSVVTPRGLVWHVYVNEIGNSLDETYWKSVSGH